MPIHTGAIAPRGLCVNNKEYQFEVSKYKDLDIIHRAWGNKLIISSLNIGHSVPDMLDFNDLDDKIPGSLGIGQLGNIFIQQGSLGTWADSCVYGDANNQASPNQSDSNLAINQSIQSKGFKISNQSS